MENLIANNNITPLSTFSLNDPKYRNVLGYGINAFGNSKNVTCYSPILKEEFRTGNAVAVQMKHTTSYKAETEDSVEKLYEKFSMKNSTSVRYMMFSTGIDFGFSNSDASAQERKYTKIVAMYDLCDAWLKEYEITDAHLSDDFKNDINSDLEPDILFSRYGTHLITGGIYGGRVDAAFSYNKDSRSNNRNFDAKLNVGIGRLLNQETSTEWTETMELINSSVNFNASAIGGKGFAGASISSFASAYADWCNTVNENPVFCGVYNEDNLIPVWEFAADPARKKQLEDHYNAEMQKIGDNFCEGGYITDIRIVHGKTPAEAKSNRPNNYTLLDVDLNHGVQDCCPDAIYLCYKRGPKSEAITNIIGTDIFTLCEIFDRGNVKYTEKEWEEIRQAADLGNEKFLSSKEVYFDLNDENGVKASYKHIWNNLNGGLPFSAHIAIDRVSLDLDSIISINFTKDEIYKPIKELEVAINNAPPEADKYIVKMAGSGNGANLNKGTYGDALYLIMKR